MDTIFESKGTHNLLEKELRFVGEETNAALLKWIPSAMHPLVTNDMTFEEYKSILETNNPFDLDIKIKRAYSFSDSILSNAEKILRFTN